MFGAISMAFHPITFLCVAALFLALLRDRFRFWTTLGVSFGVYILAILAANITGGLVSDAALSIHAACAAGTLVFLGASFVLFRNNPLHKIFVALLCMANFSYSQLLLPLLLGAMPGSPAGVTGAVVSILVMVFLSFLMGSCLYRPLQRYSGRGGSGFIIGMSLTLIFLYILCTGRLDDPLLIDSPYHRLLMATLVYLAVIFCFRSVYHAGRYQAETAREEARSRMIQMESGDYVDLLAAVREVNLVQRSGEYALDTVAQLIREGQTDRVPVYIKMTKQNLETSPILARYHENPYLNAVIATKAAFAFQNNIDFQSNAFTGDVPFTTAELCILVNEMLTRACSEAANFDGDRHLRFTAIPSEDALRLEAVYSGSLPEKDKFSPKGKQFSDLLAWLFEDSPQEDEEFKGLDNSKEIALAHSGSVTVSGAPNEVILRIKLRY